MLSALGVGAAFGRGSGLTTTAEPASFVERNARTTTSRTVTVRAQASTVMIRPALPTRGVAEGGTLSTPVDSMVPGEDSPRACKVG
jgi:hypothetical protein